MSASLGVFICRASSRTNGLKRVHFQRDSHAAGEQPEDVYANVKTDTEYVMGRKYIIQVIPVIDDQH